MATHAGAAGSISQALTLTSGKWYRLGYSVSGRTAGTVVPRLTGGSTRTGTGRAANGTYADRIQAVTGNNTLGFSDEDKMAFAVWVVKQGLDVFAHYQRGGRMAAGAGQDGGQVIYLYYAAYLLNSAEMLAAAHAMRQNWKEQPWRVTEYMLGRPVVRADGPSDRWMRPYTIEDLGRADWTHSDVDLANASPEARYRTTAWAMCLVEPLAVCLLINGPTGKTGAEELIDAGRGQVIEYMDYVRRMSPISYVSGGYMYNKYPAVYDAVRSSFAPAVVPRAPFELQPYRSHIVSAAGGVTVNFQGADYSILPVTNRWFEFSLDGRSFVRRPGLANTQLITDGLMVGVQHYGRIAQDSAAGIGKPTQIAQQQSTVSSVMGAFLPSGAGLTGIPINSAPPRVVMRPHIQYQGNLFAACPAEVPFEGRLQSPFKRPLSKSFCCKYSCPATAVAFGKLFLDRDGIPASRGGNAASWPALRAETKQIHGRC